MKQLLAQDSLKKTGIFVLFGGIGALLGSLLGYPIGGTASTGALIEALIRVGIWDALIGIGIGIALSMSQNYYSKRLKTGYKEALGVGIRGAVAGFLGGIVLVLTRKLLGSSLLVLCLAWTFEGAVMRYLLAPVIPNLPKKSALFAGAIAGGLGAILMIMLSRIGIGSSLSVALGDSCKGLFLGLMLTATEALIRKAWIVVHWTPNERTTISLGENPIILRSSDEAHIYLPQSRGYFPITATIALENQEILMKFNEEYAQPPRNMKKLLHHLKDGDKRKLGDVLIEVQTA
ncbi:hypothetical protein FLX56_27180 [Synechococcus moorigangaii CMS01]|nr:hypothetical protein [Synechococcus moorigangaii CMS01]